MFTGGKRLRPIIGLETFKMFEKEIDKVLPYLSAIEMIHTYSLIHDDLPSMDNDKLRRGKPTNHIIFGEAMAILTGDALLNLAFEIMSKDISTNSNSIEDYQRKSRAIMEISNYSGLKGMIGGQIVDLFSSSQEVSEDLIFFMYKSKTAALFQSAIVASAIIGGANKEEIKILREFGLYMGIAYQIQDDILDAKEDSEMQKLTYLKYYNREKASKDMLSYSEKSINLLNRLENKNIDFLQNMVNILVNRQK